MFIMLSFLVIYCYVLKISIHLYNHEKVQNVFINLKSNTKISLLDVAALF